MSDLSEATIDELYEELQGRFQDIILVARGELKMSDQESYVYFRWDQGWVNACGLVRWADSYLMDHRLEKYREAEPGETPIG